MSGNELAALITAIATLIGALGAVFVQLRVNHKQVNGRMDELIETTKLAALTSGELTGRDQERSRAAEALAAEARSEKPS
jgi:hypothetical protein